MTFQQVQKYERGTNRLSAVKLKAVSALLGISAMDLLEVEARAPSPVLTASTTASTPLDDEVALLVQAFRSIGDARQRRSVLAIALELSQSGTAANSAIVGSGPIAAAKHRREH